MPEENNNVKKKCFVITPIGEDGSDIRRHIDGIIRAAIRPALENKYEVKAAHEFTTIGSINNQVIVNIYEADLVVANLTGLNPNVMYELAIRHALKKPVIMIMEKNNGRLPFDVVAERTIFYINDSQGVLDLRDEIEKVEAVIDSDKITNPIYDALNTYVSDESLIKEIEKTHNGDVDVLKVILNKLNSLQDNIRSVKSEDSIDLNTSNSEKLIVNIHFENSANQKEVKSIIRKILDSTVDTIRKYSLSSVISYRRNPEGFFEFDIPNVSKTSLDKLIIEIREIIHNYMINNKYSTTFEFDFYTI